LGYFKPKDDIVPDPLRGLAMRKTNLIPDIFNAELYLDKRRSPRPMAATGFMRISASARNRCA
jgi:hypothetical protein